jgi:hypothetical protein
LRTSDTGSRSNWYRDFVTKFGICILYARRKFYIYVLICMGALSFPVVSGCGPAGDPEDGQDPAGDSINAAHLRDSIARKDSALAAQIEKARLDSIAKADSVAKGLKKKKIIVDPNEELIDKYGIPPNFR